MTTTNEVVTRTPAGNNLSNVNLTADMSAEGDLTGYVYLTGPVTYQGTGPVSAITLGLQRSTQDPSAGAGNPVEVADDTGAGSGVAGSYDGIGSAWYRLVNKATFGPAADVLNRTLESVAAAINGLQPSPFYGHDFAAGSDSVPEVHAEVTDDGELTVTATTPGVAGNSIATTAVTDGDGAWANATLTGGADAEAADGTLTFVDVPDADMTVTIGDVVYTFVDDPADFDVYSVLIGGTIEETRDNLLDAINGEGTPATGILTANANPAAGTTVRLGDYTYTFVTSLSSPRVAFQVKLGATASDTLDNLIAAINSTAAAADSTYSSNTPPNPDATAAAGTGDTVDVTAAYAGAASNEIITQGSGADVKATSTLTFTPGTVTTQTIQLGGKYYIYAADPTTDALADGSSGHPYQVDVGTTATISLANLAAAINATGVRGTTYSYTLAPNNANALAEATSSDATTVSVRARAAGTGGNSISTTVPSGAGFAWTSTVMAGGLSSLTWGAATLEDGTGSGVTYSSDVEAHPLVDATDVSTDALTATTKTAGEDGNDIDTTDTLTDVKATGTLTFTPGTVTTQKFNIGGVYYIYAADPTSDASADGTTAHPWQVDVGATATDSLANLASAINADGTPGTTYSTDLTANPLATAPASDATTVSLEAILAGAAGDSIATVVVSGTGFAFGAATLTGGGGSWTAATLTGGSDAVAATGVFTATDDLIDGDSITVSTVTYDIVDDLTPVANEVMVAGTAAQVVLSGQVAANV